LTLQFCYLYRHQADSATTFETFVLLGKQLSAAGNDGLMILGNKRNKQTFAGTLEDFLIFPVVVAHFKRAADNPNPVASRLI